MKKRENSLENFGKEDFKRVIDSLSEYYDVNENSSSEKIFEGFKTTWLKIIENINNNLDGIEEYNTYEFEFNRSIIVYRLQTDDLISYDKTFEYYAELNNLSAQLTDAVKHARSRYRKNKFKETSKIQCKIYDMVTGLFDMIKEFVKK